MDATATDAAAPTSAVGAIEGTPGEADIAFDYGPGTFNFPVAAASLSDLSSYHATLTLSFSGTEVGQPLQWLRRYDMRATLEPAARELIVAAPNANGEVEQVYRAEVNGLAFERHGDGDCTASAIYPEDSLATRWEPAGFLTGLTGAEEAGSETVNAVAARHYTFDERAFGPLPPHTATGELWVAEDGGYLVRYLATIVGTPEYFGEGVEGTLTWDYQLTEANQPLAIEVPTDCPAGLVDAPILPDAAAQHSAPGLLTYTTASSLADVLAFYQVELPGSGWQPSGEPLISETTAFQAFTRADQQLSVVATTAAGATSVRLALGPLQP